MKDFRYSIQHFRQAKKVKKKKGGLYLGSERWLGLHPPVPKTVCNDKSELQRLRGIEPGVTMCVVA